VAGALKKLVAVEGNVKMMAFNLLEELDKNFPPLDIAHATKEDLLRLRMVGLSDEDEKKAIARAKELGMLKEKSSGRTKQTNDM